MQWSNELNFLLVVRVWGTCGCGSTSSPTSPAPGWTAPCPAPPRCPREAAQAGPSTSTLDTHPVTRAPTPSPPMQSQTTLSLTPQCPPDPAPRWGHVTTPQLSENIWINDHTIGWQNLNLLSHPNATLAPQQRQARASGENLNYMTLALQARQGSGEILNYLLSH